MSDRDIELDQILGPLLEVRPSAKQMQRWRTLGPSGGRDWVRRGLQLLAAACVGFVVGAMFFRNPPVTENVAANFDGTATIEMTYVKGQ